MDNWISIDEQKCDSCAICVRVCVMGRFRKRDGEVTGRADKNSCMLCGHCVAICPTGAITHGKLDMDNFIPAEETADFDTDTFRQFIRQRRSHRNFKDKRVPREDLEKLIDTCRYAATGGNMQGVEIMVVEDADVRKRLSDLTVDFFAERGEQARKELETLEAEGEQVDKSVLLGLRMRAQYGEGLALAHKAGRDPIFHNAPAVVIFHSPAGPGTPKDDCVIASTIMGLTARTMGLETTYIGMLETSSRTSEPVIKELDLPRGHEVFSVLIVGYPKYRYVRTVDRRRIKTRWK